MNFNVDESRVNDAVNGNFFSRVWKLVTPYWRSEEKGMAWVLLIGNVFWTLAYDTEYAMVDRDDDLKIGIKTSAITFGRYDVAIIMLCYAVFLLLWLACGWYLGLRYWYVAGLLVAAGCAVYHYTLIRARERMPCFAAFRHNNWLGAAVFAGVVLDFAFR